MAEHLTSPLLDCAAAPQAPIGLNVLLVEDDPLDAQLIEETLRQAYAESPSLQPLRLHRVQTPEGFAAQIQEKDYQIILADYNLPTFDGPHALQLAQSLCPAVPFIVVSGALGDERAIGILKLGATDFVLKDRLEMLPQSIERALREADDRLRRRQAEAETLQSAAFEKQLIGIVSHDLRNPLSAICMAGALLMRKVEPPQRRSVQHIIDAAQRSIRLIQNLLDFTQARLGGGIPIERKPADLWEVVRCTVDEVRLIYPQRQIDVQVAGCAAGHWDADRMTQAVGNLLTNALQYSPSDSVVTLRGRAEDRQLTLESHNWGEAINAETLAELFEPLKRGANLAGTRQRNIGLGLYIVRAIALAHGGSVAVCSTQEGGTTFTMTLPKHISAIVGPQAVRAPSEVGS
jgi:signal transduction histidine kinase